MIRRMALALILTATVLGAALTISDAGAWGCGPGIKCVTTTTGPENSTTSVPETTVPSTTTESTTTTSTTTTSTTTTSTSTTVPSVPPTTVPFDPPTVIRLAG